MDRCNDMSSVNEIGLPRKSSPLRVERAVMPFGSSCSSLFKQFSLPNRVSCAMLSGKRAMWLLERYSTARLDRQPTSRGMLESRLLFTYNSERLVSRVMVSGRVWIVFLCMGAPVVLCQKKMVIYESLRAGRQHKPS